MIKEKSVLAIIPARGGSKGIPRKNIRLLAGKPLIAWTIDEAKKSKYIDRLILSSEDEEIIKVAKDWGCEVPFIRPVELAQDDTPGIEPVLHALDTLNEKYDYVMLLQVTSPLRQVNDIDGCVEMCIDSNASSCVSVAEVNQHPYLMYTVDNDGNLHTLVDQKEKVSRRQDLPAVYILNGAVYIAESTWIRHSRSFLKPNTKAYVMPQDRSQDIDDFIDLQIAELILKAR